MKLMFKNNFTWLTVTWLVLATDYGHTMITKYLIVYSQIHIPNPNIFSFEMLILAKEKPNFTWIRYHIDPNLIFFDINNFPTKNLQTAVKQIFKRQIETLHISPIST